MGVFVNPGNSAFQTALNSEIYVDKTGLLEFTNNSLDTLQGYICNSRPRRFGKSITANMLAAYYSKGCDSLEMFSGLQISNSPDFKKHLNKYDVIHLDIQWCLGPAGGSAQVVSYISKKVIEELRSIYPNALQREVLSLAEALSDINNATGSKFIIIIDEWDVLIRDESSLEVQEQYIAFLRGLFKGTEPTKYIKLAYLTGILPIKKEKTQSALNNFDEYTMLDAGALSPYVGFTENEVCELCAKYDRDFNRVKHWYDGYQLGEDHVYNPRAVVSLMLNGNFKSYWSGTGSYEAVVPLINMDFDGLKTAVIEMLSGNTVEVDVLSYCNDTVSFASKDDVLTYLIHLGYLGYEQSSTQAFVPNEELRLELANAMKSTKWNEFFAFQRQSESLLEATLDMDVNTAADYIEKMHMEYVSTLQYNNENSLSSVITIAYLSAMRYYFKPVRELPTGRGFADFVFIPKPQYKNDYPALVIELKWNKTVQTALDQIKEKNYPESISQNTGNILLVAVNYDKKTKQHECMIEPYHAS